MYLSSIVLEEFRKHFKLKLSESEKQLRKLNNELMKLSNFTEEKDLLKVDFNKMQENFANNIVHYLVNEFKLVKTPKDKYLRTIVDNMVSNAVNEVPPFEKNDKGFRDSLILDSYLYYIKDNKLNNNVFIVNDNIFKEAEVLKYIEKLDVKVEFLNKLEDLFLKPNIIKHLQTTQEIIEIERNIEIKIRETINNNFEYISERVIKSFEEEIGLKLFKDDKVKSHDQIFIDDVSFDYQSEEHLWITIYFKTNFHLIVREWTFVKEIGISYLRETDVETVPVLGTINFEIPLNNLKDVNNLVINKTHIETICVEDIQKNYDNNETKFEHMPI